MKPRDYNWRHNSALGGIVRSRNFITTILSTPSLSNDARTYLKEAIKQLNLAEDQVRTYRKNPDGNLERIR